MSWYNSNWKRRIKITSDVTKVDASVKGLALDLKNMPSEFWEHVKEDGSDIRITKSNGVTELARDVISINKIDLTDGLVSYYDLDETSGTTAEDSHGSNDGTADRQEIFTSEVDGIINTGAEFTTNTDKIEIDDLYVAPFSTSAGSFSGWVKRTSQGLGDEYFYWARPSNGTDRFYLTTKDAKFQFYFGSTGYINSGVSVTNDQWYHVVATFDSNNYEVYINGNLEASGSFSGSSGTATIPSKIVVNQPIHQFYGVVDEVGIWSRALSEHEVELLYSNSDGRPYSDFMTGTGLIRFDTGDISTSSDEDYYLYFDNENADEPSASSTYGQYNAYDNDLEAYWSFESTTDRTDSQITGTLVNNATVNTTDGKLGKALDLNDNRQSHMTIGTDWNTRIGGNQFTVLVWARLDKAPDTDEKNLFYVGSSSSFSNVPSSLRDQNGNFFNYSRSGTSGLGETSSGVQATQNNWFLVGYSRNGNNGTIFVNGVQEGTSNDSNNSVTVPSSNAAAWGYINWITTDRNWKGLLDEGRIYTNINLTENDFSTIYNNESDNSSFWTIGDVEEPSDIEVSNGVFYGTNF